MSTITTEKLNEARAVLNQATADYEKTLEAMERHRTSKTIAAEQAAWETFTTAWTRWVCAKEANLPENRGFTQPYVDMMEATEQMG